jgi:hypothetical protein
LAFIKKGGGTRPFETLATNFKFLPDSYRNGIGKPVLNPISVPIAIGSEKKISRKIY